MPWHKNFLLNGIYLFTSRYHNYFPMKCVIITNSVSCNTVLHISNFKIWNIWFLWIVFTKGITYKTHYLVCFKCWHQNPITDHIGTFLILVLWPYESKDVYMWRLNVWLLSWGNIQIHHIPLIPPTSVTSKSMLKHLSSWKRFPWVTNGSTSSLYFELSSFFSFMGKGQIKNSKWRA